MPELPEVETTKRGITPHIKNKTISSVIVRQTQLRWPVSPEISQLLPHQQILDIKRRAKYLLLETQLGTVIIHLGMSGSLRIVKKSEPVKKHDHIDIIFADDTCLRYHDPRRFGAFLWTSEPIEEHKLIEKLGPEPLTDAFYLDDFYSKAKKRTLPIKSFMMDGHMVVGVGNIYASESLFLSKIHPSRACNKVSKARLNTLIHAIKTILRSSIEQGGTTLKDFVNSDGKPGYFQQTLNVYGRKGQPCTHCSTPIKQVTIGQRSTFYCPTCQH
ncbi:MAG: DNA-formamidopyrimidine glycosylase [Piscirickettsiaceae bacterium]|nr:MAG: DNA-formamidopyrimidine glycosylase [Piscirickettsiaceae bacterium]PCI68445.1 MAG: DNA-formamidopyrimidine glycosylase [Piscirickettsiaceae bacterium]